MDKYGKHENASENQETGFSSKTPETPPERVDPCLEKGISLQNQGCTDASLKPKPIGESNPQIQAQFRHIFPYFPRIFRFILFPFYNKK